MTVPTADESRAQPAPVDRKALVDVILDAMLGRYPGRDMARAVADALLAAGWGRLPRHEGPNEAMVQMREEYVSVREIAAGRRGAERMRERAAQQVEASAAIVDHPSVFMGGPSRNAQRIAGAFAKQVRALPLTEETDDDDR